MAKSILNRKQRIILLKLMALLSLVRWYNILLIIISQYLTAIFILKPHLGMLSILLDYRLFLIAASSSFIIAGGYIINSFYDLEKDLVNQPRKIIFERYISKWFSLNCYFLFSIIGLILSYFASYRILIFNAAFIFVLWFYSHKLKKLFFVGNLSATILSIAPFFSICIYYNKINPLILAYVSFIFMVELTREIVKDLDALKGDIIYGYHTIPASWGIQKTKLFLYFLMAITFVPPLIISHNLSNFFITLYFIVSAALVIISAIKLAAHSADYNAINTIYKLIILLGIGSIILI